jgi:hypothetical protein
LTSLSESGHRKEVAKMWLAIRGKGDEVVVVEKQALAWAYQAYKQGRLQEAGWIIANMTAWVFSGVSAVFEGLKTFEEDVDLDFKSLMEAKAVLLLGLLLPEEALGEDGEVMPVGILTAGRKKWEVEILLVRESWLK